MIHLTRLVIMAAVAALISTSAEAHSHRHRHLHHHHRPAHQRLDTNYRSGFQNGDLVYNARQLVGATAAQLGLRRTLWCSAFARLVAGTPRGVNDRADSWLSQRHVAPRVGALVVLRSKRRHVGVVSGFDANGNPVVISGNSRGNRVSEHTYQKSRVIAYVEPFS